MRWSADEYDRRELQATPEGYVPAGSTRAVEFIAPTYTLDDGTVYAAVHIGEPESDGTWERFCESPRLLRQHNTTHLFLTLSSHQLLYLGSRLLIYRGEEGGWRAAGRSWGEVTQQTVEAGDDLRGEGPNLTNLWRSIRHEDAIWPSDVKNDAADVDLEDDDG